MRTLFLALLLPTLGLSQEIAPKHKGLVRADLADYLNTHGAQGAPGVSVTVEQFHNGAWSPVNPRQVFHTGDQIRFAIRANFDCYLAITASWSIPNAVFS